MVNPNPNNLSADPSTMSLQVKNINLDLNLCENFAI